MPAPLTKPISGPSTTAAATTAGPGFLADVASDESAADLVGQRLATPALQVGDDDMAAAGLQGAKSPPTDFCRQMRGTSLKPP